MQTFHVVRVVLAGTTPQGQSERITTIIRVLAADLADNKHLEVARFRGGVRGLRAPWHLEAEYEVARTRGDEPGVATRIPRAA